ncbi:hypothetical protein K493DRAFT_295665 [Basidiobolus meristosporus CBS 931.73]|uniref:Uncharacterized protein n=1 Tax=Basidiobolus meristosporus CBS 931.73 TaxID=1314790 RepID=A0A1Y1ZA10_9FUNG|nr:hypothetical protein K493DRAFT_295665 [Basidiobolus meristosporus CBS 931.73]|eukprot:ORY07091.1 hypothetical protein K493DRAFT_295665 [Basidiobolus meristosporus CBS 931.73]
MFILSFLSSCCTVERIERCSDSPKTARSSSIVPILDHKSGQYASPDDARPSLFIKMHPRTTVCLEMSQTSNTLDFSNDLESVRAKLRKVDFDEAIDFGFTNDLGSTRVKTIRFTLTPNSLRN